MDMQANVLQRKQHATDVIGRDILVLSAFPNKPQLRTTSELTAGPFLGTLSTEEESSWVISIQLEGKQMSFKIDIGAEVTAISDQAFKTLENVTWQEPAGVLFGPTQHALKYWDSLMVPFKLVRKPPWRLFLLYLD